MNVVTQITKMFENIKQLVHDDDMVISILLGDTYNGNIHSREELIQWAIQKSRHDTITNNSLSHLLNGTMRTYK